MLITQVKQQNYSATTIHIRITTIMANYCGIKPRVAIIGAGVSGLVVGKYVYSEFMTATKCGYKHIIRILPIFENSIIGLTNMLIFLLRCLRAEGFEPVIYERNEAPGGVWCSQDEESPFKSAVYEDLEANFPRHLMEFAGFPWKPRSSLFPTRVAIEEYLKDYSTDLPVMYGIEVVKVHHHYHDWVYNRYRDWRVITRKIVRPDEGNSNWESARQHMHQEVFNFVIVATGTFDKPFMPQYEGLPVWQSKFPNSVIHSKEYRRARDFQLKVRDSRLWAIYPFYNFFSFGGRGVERGRLKIGRVKTESNKESR